MGGVDEPQCLNHSLETTCSTIGYPIHNGFKTICITGTLNNKSEYIELHRIDDETNDVNIICQGCVIEKSEFTLLCVTGYKCRVTLSTVTMRACKFDFRNIHATFNNVNLENILIKDNSHLNQNKNNHIYIENSTFSCMLYSLTCGIRINNTVASMISLLKSEFFTVPLYVDVDRFIIRLFEMIFVQPMINVRVKSFEYLRIPAIVRFEKVTAIQEITNLRNRSLTSAQKQHSSQLRSSIKLQLVNPHVIITESVFSGCHLEIHSLKLYFKPVFFSVFICKSVFENGYNEGHGGGLMITSQVHRSKIVIVSTRFYNNTVVKKHGEMKGNGGGLYVAADSLQLDMEHCLFIDNEADESGLALYTSEGVTTSLINCSFHYNVKPYNVPKDSLFFAAGLVSYFSGHFQIANIKPEFSVGPIFVFYIGKTEQIDIGNRCPKFYKHVTEYTSKSTAPHLIPDLRHECRPCSDNYYTNTSSNKLISYLGGNTSLTNGLFLEKPTDLCMQCPYGGLCTGNNVIPRPNYWGHWHDGQLVFHQCPAGYCCFGTDYSICNRFDHCRENRTGILCGSCQEGFSVSILTGECTPNSQCNGDQWFWLFALSSALMYALWYTFKDAIFGCIFIIFASVKEACIRLKSRQNIDALKSDQLKSQHVQENLDQSSGANRVDKGYFGIIAYYVQMAAVIRIEIEFSDIDKSEPFLDKLVDNVERFLNIELTKMSYDACPIVGLTTVGKLFYSLSFMLGIFISWMGMFIGILFMLKISKRQVKLDKNVRKLKSLRVILIGGIIEIFKYTYAGFCGIIFKSLVCTKIGNHYVWWYDAIHTCLENWQVMIVIFAVVYAIPFPLILILGLKFLKEGKISTAKFISCCLCPLVALLLLSIYRCLNKNAAINKNNSLSKTSNLVISILQGPYKDDEKNMTLFWEAMVSIRRLLITSMTLVPYVSIRMSIISALSLVFLIQHNHISPFQVRTSNNIETLSLALLCATSVINLLKATLTDSGVVPSGPSVHFFKSLEFCEKLFVFFIIGFIFSIEFKLWKKRDRKSHEK